MSAVVRDTETGEQIAIELEEVEPAMCSCNHPLHLGPCSALTTTVWRLRFGLRAEAVEPCGCPGPAAMLAEVSHA